MVKYIIIIYVKYKQEPPMINNLNQLSEKIYNTDFKSLDNEQIYKVLSELSNQMLLQRKQNSKDKRKLYYLSAEFLIGKLLKNNLENLGIRDEIEKILLENGKTLAQIETVEPEPSLGNGGLGRLASCFLDSLTSLDLKGDGVGINYHLGLFKQTFKNNSQLEIPNPWLEKSNALIKTDVTNIVKFGDLELKAVMYDLPISGSGQTSNTLHLFDIETADESIVKDGINFDKKDIKKNLTLFLYPDDSDLDGRHLRIYQQYFMVCNAAYLILKELQDNGHSLDELDKYAVVQINDTHPSIIIPELIRQLTQNGIAFERAVEIVTNTCAYTNHTILLEALEKWPYESLKQIVPQLIPIINKLNEIIAEKYPENESLHIVRNVPMKFKKVSSVNKPYYILKNIKIVHMATMAIHFSKSTNGVAKLHTDILKEDTLKDFYKIYPEKFSNKTNGISFRRFMYYSNRQLSDYITELIGDGYKKDSNKLKELMKYIDDEKVLNKFAQIKKDAKINLSNYIKETENIYLDDSYIFDVQIKRLHEYKRQQMNALYVIDTYLKIKKGIYPAHPICVIFGAKAAPAYTMAKNIIHLILCLQQLIENDKDVQKHLKVIMVTNYNVDYAEKIIPAADISEQISLASKEASGTGNMKMMLNGAVTIGTMDGANVEIAEYVGKENIYIFGKSAQEVIKLYETNGYKSSEIYENNQAVKDAVDFIISDELNKYADLTKLEALHYDLITKDWFMALLDLQDYIKVKNELIEKYNDPIAYRKMSLVNIANSGYFSADRTIQDYNNDIWKL